MTAPTATPADLSGTYTLDPSHTRLGFTARHAMVTKVRGSFGDFEATANLDFTDPTKSSANVTIQVASIDTGSVQRDEHLRTNDFFDVPSFPTWTFASTGVEPKGGDGSLIEVSGQGRSVRVGRHLRPELRPALAREIRMALRGC